MKINGKKVIGKKFAFDGCHKIYIIENEKDLNEVYINGGYEIFDNLKDLEKVYENACPLRFINNWQLTTTYVEQGQVAIFEKTEK